MWTPDVMLFSPAGAKGILYIGIIKGFLEEPDFLKNVKTWAGVSAGTAVSLLMVAGFSIEEIESLCMEVSLVDDIMHLNLNDIKDKFGLIKLDAVEDKLKTCMIKKFGYIPTLKQLYILTGLDCVIFAFNVDKLRIEAFDKDTEPDLSCVEATMMSMSIPVLVQPRLYKGCTYVDGGIAGPYPISHFDQGISQVSHFNKGKSREEEKEEEKKNILGIYVSSEEDNYSSNQNVSNYLYKLIQAGMRTIREYEIKYSSKNVKHISIKTLIRDTTGITIPKEVREKMIEQGYEQAKTFLKINSDPEKYNVNIPDNEEIPFTLPS